MNEFKNQIVFLFTENFPYGSGEAFLENEINFASEITQIYIFPRAGYNEKNYSRKITSKVKVVNLISDEKKLSTKSKSIRNFFFNLRILTIEIFKSGKPIKVIKRSRELFSILYKAHALAELTETFRKENNIQNPVYYSYWMNEWTLALSISKDKFYLKNFIFRVLGYDIYDERHPGNYMPFRYYNYSRCAKVYAVSKNSMNYILQKNIFPQKITFSYLGTTDYGLNPMTKNAEFTILSCSRLIPLKRVHLIPAILKHINQPVKWIHIGSGPELEKVQNLISSLNKNIKVEIIPHFQDYAQLISFYLKTHIDLFLHVSETEGLGIVHLEAMSFGIPVYTTKVGGASEFMNNDNGSLFDIEFDPKEVAQLILAFINDSTKNEKYRLGIKSYWEQHFEYKKLYNEFYSKILE